MSENKRYYWLKLKDSFFDDKMVRYLRKLPDGNALVIVFLKMQLKALNTEGVLRYDKMLPTIEEEFALMLDEDESLVRLTISALEKLGAVEKLDDGSLFILAMQELIGGEGSSTERVRRHRENKKIQEANNVTEHCCTSVTCNTDVTPCNTDVTICNTEKEIEKDIDIDLDIHQHLHQEFKSQENSEKQERQNKKIVDEDDFIASQDFQKADLGPCQSGSREHNDVTTFFNAPLLTNNELRQLATITFEAWSREKLPTADKDIMSWTQRDFYAGVATLKKCGFTPVEIINAIHNLGKVKVLYDTGQSRINGIPRFPSFCEKVGKYVDGVFDINVFRKPMSHGLAGSRAQAGGDYGAEF